MGIEENGNVWNKESEEQEENSILPTKSRRWVGEENKSAAVPVFTAGRVVPTRLPRILTLNVS